MMYNKKFLIFAALLLVCCGGANTLNNPEDLEIEVEELATTCPIVCPALYAPTCGFDGANYEEFNNPCLLNVANCEREQQRSLMKPFAQTDIDWCTTQLVDNLYDLFSKMDVDVNKPECLKACTMMYEPVCISNGKYRSTIANPCLLDQLNCAINGTALGSALFKQLSARKCELD